ncbi:MAG TPA: glycosyltransferase family 87 protein [Pseudonocardia sp.]|uniref:glycosyltransferase family 87 protein n=1 Tax=Pseudonocardia sp. TaxID=60912 RepID=UPI002CEAA52E|nr:glycosyltransferase family 87 protein [Pseudonocardia sp.]HTF53020.1 glycosyltransferase family 87 protein [Pseudonocardia sp.]
MTDVLRRLPNKIAPLVAGAALLVAAWLYVRFGSLNMARLASPDMRVHVDFDSFWSSAVALRQHTDLYRTGSLLPNLDPPVLAVLLSPLTELDVLPAYRLFALLTTVMVVGASVAVAEWTGLSARWAAVAVAALLLSAPLQSTVALGQVYGLLAVALTVAWVAERRGRLGWSGVALGLAIALKPSLLPLLLWPVVRRRWRSLLAALAAGAVATAVGVVAAGWSAIGDWLGLLRTVQVTGFLDNDSLAALAVRWHLPAWVGYLVAAALLVVTLWRARRRPEHAIWSITAAALLLAPIAWNNYLVLLAPALPMLLARGRTRAALPLLALPVIGIEWALLLPPGDSWLTRLGMSLYCGMLLTYWAVLTFAQAEEPTPADWSAELDAWPDTVRERVPG